MQTHWKQSVFYMENSFKVRKGDRVTGYFGLCKNRRNPRHIDFVINCQIDPDNKRDNEVTEETKLFEMH